MAQLSDDCFAHGGRLMTRDEALDLLRERLDCVTEPERAPLHDCLGRVLAEDVTAPFDVPPGDNSAVDGYALYFDDLESGGDTRLDVVGRATAGHPWDAPVARGTAVRIFTGAAMPSGPDTVMMQEDCRIEGDAVVIRPGIKRGANRREAGEDIRAGAVVLGRGRRLRPQDLGHAAAVGRTHLTVSRPLQVALMSTGDELAEPGESLGPGEIYDSNRYSLYGLLTALGCTVTDLGIVPDRPEAVRDALEGASAGHDLILTSGGVSTGEEDHVKQAVEALGRMHAWRLAIKPGRPIALGQVGRVPFIGLPGNPVAVMVTFLNIVRPAILRLMGAADLAPHAFRVTAGFDHRKKAHRREWVRVHLVPDGDMGWKAVKFPRDGAGILSSLVESEGLVELPEELTFLEKGMAVDFLPFSEVLS